MNRRFIEVVAALVIGAVLAYGIAWYNRPAPIPPGVTVEATAAKEVKSESKVDVVVKPPIKAYKHGVKGTLKLPEIVVSDEAKHVVASSKTANDERPHTITTVVDSGTGEVTTYDRIDPLPWLAVNTKSEFGVYYGLKSGEQTVRIEGRQELLQIKSVHIGAIASADVNRAGTDGFIGVGAWARW